MEASGSVPRLAPIVRMTDLLQTLANCRTRARSQLPLPAKAGRDWLRLDNERSIEPVNCRHARFVVEPHHAHEALDVTGTLFTVRDGAGLLLGLPELKSIGKFTIDNARGQLTFN